MTVNDHPLHPQQPLDAGMIHSEAGEPLDINENVTRYWTEIAAWCTFSGALLFFIALVLALSWYMAQSDQFAYISTFRSAIIGGMVTASALPAWFFWKTGSNIRLGMLRQENETIEHAFAQMLYAYQFTVLLSVVTIASVLLLGGEAIISLLKQTEI